MQNRRKSLRHRVSLKGKISAYGQRISVQVENLSRGGARVSLDTPLMEGSPVEVSFPMALEDAHCKSGHFRAKGEVVWCNEHMDAGFQVGIRFDEIKKETMELLKTLLESHPPV